MTNHNKPTNAYQPNVAKTDEERQQISNGLIKKRAKENFIFSITSNVNTELENRQIISKTFDVIETEVENGNIKNAVDIIKAFKEPSEQKINIKSDNLNKQVIIDENAIKNALSDINEL